METKHKTVDMLHGPLTGKLIAFALPIALSSMLQQLFNAADTAVVGRFADSTALAAVGTNAEIIALLVSFAVGLSIGANVLISRMIGRNDLRDIPDAIQNSVLFSVLAGIVVCILGQFVAGPLLASIHVPAEILPQATSYLKIYFIGYPFLMVYDFGAAILRSYGDSRTPFYVLASSGVLNVLLNLFFVVVCHMGVNGVATATAVSTAVSAIAVLVPLMRNRSCFHLSFRKLHLRGDLVMQVIKIGAPSGIQGGVFCLANIFVQSAINTFGPSVIAGSSIALNFEYFAYYMITAYAQAATTFTSQNHAAGNLARCRKILVLCLILCSVFTGAISLTVMPFRESVASIFSTDPEVIHAACVRMSFIYGPVLICGLFEVPAGYLRGMSHSTLPAVLAIIGICLVRIVWIFAVFPHFNTPESLFAVYPITWFITIFLTAVAIVVLERQEARKAAANVHAPEHAGIPAAEHTVVQPSPASGN